MTPDAVAALARKLIAARARNEKLTPPLDIPGPQSLADALSVAMAAMLGAPAAWKIGGSNRASRAAFGVNTPYFGPLAASEVFTCPASIDRAAYPAPLFAEPEIAIAFNRAFEPSLARRDRRDLKAAVAWVAPAIEFPASCLADAASAGVFWLVADRCAAGALVIGPKGGPEMLETLEAAPWTITAGGADAARPGEGLIAPTLEIVADVLVEFGRHGLTLPAGVILSTGGLSPAIDASRAASVEASGLTTVTVSLHG